MGSTDMQDRGEVRISSSCPSAREGLPGAHRSSMRLNHSGSTGG